MTNLEIWRDIKGYEGLYQVSNLGRVKSIERIDSLSRLRYERILKMYKINGGYLQVCLFNNKKINYLVHRLVWEAFNGKIPDGYEINHLDENPENNNLSNLSLVTHKENCNWGSYNINLSKSLKNNIKTSKQIIQYDFEGNIVKEWPSVSEIQRTLGYCTTSICNSCKGKQKQSYGYVWKYK